MKPPVSRLAVFVVLCAVCVVASILFAISAARRSKSAQISNVAKVEPSSPSTQPPAETTPPVIPPPIQDKKKAETPPPQPNAPGVFFSANTVGPNYGKLAFARLASLDEIRYAPELSCDRVYFASGRGVCLAADRGVFTTYSAITFDADMRSGRTINLDGIPSRVRVSPNGRLAAITVFLSGHSYATLNFATRTTIIDTRSGEVLADLDQFSVERNHERFQEADFNFWGVTFTRDENRFYATLWSKAHTYLIDCDLAKRTARVIHDNVECPSLSPDNTRIAFKKRVSSQRVAWRIHVLDLATLTEIPLGETRSVDDQVEWMDNGHILYALSANEKGASPSTDIWILPTTTDGSPRILLRGGWSPSIASLPKN